MAGVVRTIPSHSSRSAPRAVKAPRPPNAWIIYRSDKVHQLPPVKAGQPRRAQAEVSKMISNMWQNESEETRQEYERRAEEAKAAHALKYPGYRFKPMKKEEKRAQREQEQSERLAKRQDCHRQGSTPERSSASPSTHLASPLPQYYASINMPINLQHIGPGSASTLPYPFMPYYPPQTRFGPAGPTPPVSAAASPTSSSSALSSTEESQTQSPSSALEQKLSSSPLYITQNKASISPAPVPAVAVPNPNTASDAAIFPTFNTTTFVSEQEWAHAALGTTMGNGALPPVLTPAPLWQEVDSKQKEERRPLQEPSTTTQAVPTENVSFNFESYQLTNLDNLLSGSTDDTLSVFMNTVSGSNIFDTRHLDADRLLAIPTGEMEILLGEHLDLNSFPAELFNFGDPWVANTVSTEHYIPTPIPSAGLDVVAGSHESSTSTMGYNPDDYLDFGPSSVFGETNDIPVLASGVATARGEPAVVTSGPYVPPAGAVNSSFRRVGGSWTKQFVKTQTPNPPRVTGMTQSQ